MELFLEPGQEQEEHPPVLLQCPVVSVVRQGEPELQLPPQGGVLRCVSDGPSRVQCTLEATGVSVSTPPGPPCEFPLHSSPRFPGSRRAEDGPRAEFGVTAGVTASTTRTRTGPCTPSPSPTTVRTAPTGSRRSAGACRAGARTVATGGRAGGARVGRRGTRRDRPRPPCQSCPGPVPVGFRSPVALLVLLGSRESQPGRSLVARWESFQGCRLFVGWSTRGIMLSDGVSGVVIGWSVRSGPRRHRVC